MQVFQWNALRVGDAVRVHDDGSRGLELLDGVVAIVQTHPHAPNEVGIRYGTTRRVVSYPRRQAVHSSEAGAHADCWRCLAPREDVA